MACLLRISLFSCLVCLIGWVSPFSANAQIFVKFDAPGANNGTSWTDAYTDLQDALAVANAGDEIWVAEGTYRPLACNPCTEADKEIAFLLSDSVQLYGGFAGVETALGERDWVANPTVLSGDIGQPNDSLDNVFRVLIARDVSEQTVLDGFLIEAGNADGSFGFSFGGGLLIDAQNGGRGDMRVRHCTFRNNYGGGGGAVAVDCVLGGSSRALFSDCVFEGNTASLRVVSTGGAVILLGNSVAQVRTRFEGCTFRNNFVGNDGGAISATVTGASSLLAFEVDSCLFEYNRATDRGGAIWNRMTASPGVNQSRSVIKNSRFIGNVSGGQGGAVYARSSFDNVANDTILNCTFVENVANGSSNFNDGEGGAVYLRGSQGGSRDQLLANCLFFRNNASDAGGALSTSSAFFEAGQVRTKVVNCTFYGNRTDGTGGAIHLVDSLGQNELDIVNSILWADTSATGAELTSGNGAATVTSTFSNWEGGLPVGVTDGGNNLDVNPGFSDPAGDDLRLVRASPLVNVGDNASVPGLATTDLDGQVRIQDGTVDLGAYEAGRIYVDQDATGNNNGSSWANAFLRVEDGLAAAGAGDEIWVAEGTYRPVNCNPCDENDRLRSFEVQRGQVLYGGFAGTETAVDQRDWELNETILSGDIGLAGDSTDNSFQVVRMRDVGRSTVLDGFVVEEGNADGTSTNNTPFSGGGIFIDARGGLEGSPRIENCTIRNNYGGGGGGVDIDCVLGGISEALFRNCVIEGNTSSLGNVTSSGAGVRLVGNNGAQLTPRLVSCTFRENVDDGFGGGGFSATGFGAGTLLAFEIDSCVFERNRAFSHGGGIYYQMSSAGALVRSLITNSRFVGNVVGAQGGAVYARNRSGNVARDTILNCSFIENVSDGSNTFINSAQGGAVYLRAAQGGNGGHLLANCLFYRNYARDQGGALGGTSAIFGPGELNTRLVNCTFYGNRTDGTGGAIHLVDSLGQNTMNIVNSILWADTSATGAELTSGTGAATVTSTFSNWEGGLPVGVTDGGNNLSEDPQFLAPLVGDLRISACSPARDAGLNAALPPDLPDLDRDSNVTELIPLDLKADPRIVGAAVDLGAYEWANDPPEMRLAFDTSAVSCAGASDGRISVTPSGGVPAYRFSWSTGDTTASIEDLSAGTYTVEVSDNFSCVLRDTLTLGENPPLLLDLSPDTSVCAGETVQLVAAAAGGDGQYTFSWSNGLAPGAQQSVAPALNTSYRVVVRDGNGCEAVDSIQVEVTPGPDPSISGDTVICFDGVAVLDAGAFERYQWSTGDTSRTLTVDSPGVFSVTVFQNGCVGAASREVNRSTEQLVEATEPRELCEGQRVTLGTEGFATYRWSTGDTSATIEVDQAGLYELTVTNAAGCESSGTYEVVAAEAPEALISASATEVCAGDSVRLFADGQGPFNWEGPGGSLEVVGPDEALVRAASTSTYRLIATNSCGSDTAELEIRVIPPPELSVSAGRDTIAPGESVQLNVSGAESYTWTGPDLSCTNCPDPVASPSESIVYIVEGVSSAGCVATAFLPVQVVRSPEGSPPPIVEDPCTTLQPINVITPNEDGANDALVFEGLELFGSWKLTVFNRWGDTVFESFDYQNDWKGTYNGGPLPAGTYMYVLSLRTGQQRCALQNTITIIRE